MDDIYRYMILWKFLILEWLYEEKKFINLMNLKKNCLCGIVFIKIIIFFVYKNIYVEDYWKKKYLFVG